MDGERIPISEDEFSHQSPQRVVEAVDASVFELDKVAPLHQQHIHGSDGRAWGGRKVQMANKAPIRDSID
jgi:hypothetical protein